MGIHSEAGLNRKFVEFAKLLNIYLNHFPKHEKYALVYDNTEASGSKLIPTDTVIPGNVNLAMIEFGTPILAENGIYVSASVAGGGSASYQVQYDQ